MSFWLNIEVSSGSRPSDKGWGEGGHPDRKIKGGPGLKKILSALWASLQAGRHWGCYDMEQFFSK